MICMVSRSFFVLCFASFYFLLSGCAGPLSVEESHTNSRAVGIYHDAAVPHTDFIQWMGKDWSSLFVYDSFILSTGYAGDPDLSLYQYRASHFMFATDDLDVYSSAFLEELGEGYSEEISLDVRITEINCDGFSSIKNYFHVQQSGSFSDVNGFAEFNDYMKTHLDVFFEYGPLVTRFNIDRIYYYTPLADNTREDRWRIYLSEIDSKQMADYIRQYNDGSNPDFRLELRFDPSAIQERQMTLYIASLELAEAWRWKQDYLGVRTSAHYSLLNSN